MDPSTPLSRSRLSQIQRQAAVGLLRRKLPHPGSRVSKTTTKEAVRVLLVSGIVVKDRVARKLLTLAYPKSSRSCSRDAVMRKGRRFLQQGRLSARCTYRHLGLSEASPSSHIIINLSLLSKRCGSGVRVLLLHGLTNFDDKCMDALLQLLRHNTVSILSINFGEMQVGGSEGQGVCVGLTAVLTMRCTSPEFLCRPSVGKDGWQMLAEFAERKWTGGSASGFVRAEGDDSLVCVWAECERNCRLRIFRALGARRRSFEAGWQSAEMTVPPWRAKVVHSALMRASGKGTTANLAWGKPSWNPKLFVSKAPAS